MIIGIDPGLSGAVAVLFRDKLYAVDDMPTVEIVRGRKKRRDLDMAALASLIGQWQIRPGPNAPHVFIERAQAMPRQGVSTTFAFGKSYGATLGIIAALRIPVTHVHPATWKKAMGVPASKDGARARASELLPAYSEFWRRVKDDGRAEAALLALYGSRQVEIRPLDGAA